MIRKLGIYQGDPQNSYSEQVDIAESPVTAIDSTGAGEFYAAGFLHGHLSVDIRSKNAHKWELLSLRIL